MKSLHRHIRQLAAMIFSVLLISIPLLSGCGAKKEGPIPIRMLILPKFEVDAMSGDFPGEAQYYYDHYVKGGQEYEIPGGYDENRFSCGTASDST